MKYAKELKVGLFGAASIAALLAGVGYLQGSSVFSRAVRLNAVFDDIAGLKSGGFVLLNGFTVGKVHAIEMQPETGKLYVAFDITETDRIPTDSKIVITPTDFFGNKGLTLLLGKASRLAEDGDTLRDSLAVGLVDNLVAQIMPLKNKIEKVVDEVYIITKAARETVQDSASRINRIARNIEGATANVEILTGEFKGAAKRVNALTDSIKYLVSDYRNNPDIKIILKNARVASDTLVAVSTDFRQVVVSTKQSVDNLQAIMATVKRGDGTLGKLLYDPKMYTNLTDASKSLDSLLVDLRKNPKRYVSFSVFGGKKK